MFYLEIRKMQRLELHSLIVSNRARLDVLKAKAETENDSENDAELSARRGLDRKLEMFSRVNPEKAPEVQKLSVLLPASKAPVEPAVIFEAVYDVVRAVLGVTNMLGCTLDFSREYTIYPPGKKHPVVVVARCEIYVLPDEKEPGKDFVQEIAEKLEEMAKEQFGIEPEEENRENQENLLVRKLRELINEIERKCGMKLKKGKVFVLEKAVPVFSDLASLFQDFTREAQSLSEEAATLPEQLKELHAAQGEVEREKAYLENAKDRIHEEARSLAHEWYKEYSEQTWEDCQREKERFAAELLADVRREVAPERYKALAERCKDRLEHRERGEDD